MYVYIYIDIYISIMPKICLILVPPINDSRHPLTVAVCYQNVCTYNSTLSRV